MRLNCLALFIIGLTTLSYSQNRKPIVSFENKTHSFGEIQQNEGIKSYTFKFSNTGAQPLVIHNVKSSCGCAVPEWTRTPIQPGRNGVLTVAFDPKEESGNFNKSVTISSNAKNSTEILRITGSVISEKQDISKKYPREMGAIRLKSNHIPFSKIAPDAKKTQDIEFINTSNEPVTITFNRVPAHLEIKTEPSTILPGKTGIINATYDASKIDQWGFVSNRLYILLNDNRPSNGYINISASIEEDYSKWSEEELANAPRIEFKETRFEFGEVSSGSIVEHTFEVKNTGKSNLILRRVRASCGCTASTPEKNIIEPGGLTQIPVKFNTRGRSGRQSTSVSVYSNDPEKSSVTLRLSGTVKH